MKTPILLTRTEAAALLEVKPQAIDFARRAGRIHYADPERRLYDRAALLAQWQENRQRRRKPVPAGVAALVADRDSEAELRRRLLQAQVQNAERVARTEGGELVLTADVRSGASAVGGMVARALSDMPMRLSHERVGKSQREIVRILDEWQRDCRSQFVAELRRRHGVEVPAVDAG